MLSWKRPTIPHISGTPVPPRFFDTADQAVRPLTPGKTATIYVCGITPYDATHLGHAATYLTFDLVQRVLLDNGHDIHYVQNVTDIDDPLFERAERDGVNWRELGEEQIQLFREDMSALNALPPQDYIGAIESVDEVIELTERLIDSGAAYQIDERDDSEFQDVYFSVRATRQFGYESNYDVTTMSRLFAKRGGDPQRVGKHHHLDALLWRQQRPGEPSWSSPWGDGRPGWHIECAAIALNRLGQGFDIQGGGSDLIFPHHEFSAAHVEAATDTRRMARHYMHAGMIGLNGQKMSKSLGNLVFVSHLRQQGEDPMVIRLGLFSGHYRADRMWTSEVLQGARARLALWRAAVRREAAPDAMSTVQGLRRYLSDDLDTPRALEAIDSWSKEAVLGRGKDTTAPTLMADAVNALLGIVL